MPNFEQIPKFGRPKPKAAEPLNEADYKRLHLERSAGKPLDYFDTEVFEKVLVYGNESEIEHLRESVKCTPQQVEMFKKIARLRYRIVEEDERLGDLSPLVKSLDIFL